MAPKPMRQRSTEMLRLYRRRPTGPLARMIDRQFEACVAAVEDALVGNINDAELASFLESI